MNKSIINKLIEDETLSYTDVHFARLMEKISGEDDALFFAASLASSQARFGNICLNIDDVAGKSLLIGGENSADIKCPEKKAWIDALKSCPVIGRGDENKPLILEDDKRLYLYRYWDYQRKLADFINHKAKQNYVFGDNDTIILKNGLNRLFPDSGNNEIDWQKIAACISLLKKFSVISGGPGTGKTTTVTKILALLIEQWSAAEKTDNIRICLAAPTGKAAARISESISGAKMEIDCSEIIRQMIPDEASTIHRLLGSINNSPYFKYNEKRKLPADVVIIDEASMVDLALMSKLVQSIPDNARLILLGDQDQLASVAAGAVLGDICNTGTTLHYSETLINKISDITGTTLKYSPEKHVTSDLRDCITVLQKSYRFSDNSGIKTVSRAVNAGNDDLFYEVAKMNKYPDLAVASSLAGEDFQEALYKYAVKYFVPVFSEVPIEEKIKLLEKFRILCAVRKGPYGVENLNLLIEKALRRTGVITSNAKWYPGRPVMITKNDYQSGLFNGDVGITMPVDEDKTKFDVCFINSDGKIKRVRTYNLPSCETVYAMTVHKSQGSEFDSVLFIMPDHDTRVMTRELIYTGITRAREFVEILGEEGIVRKGVGRKTVRSTGLRQSLWR